MAFQSNNRSLPTNVMNMLHMDSTCVSIPERFHEFDLIQKMKDLKFLIQWRQKLDRNIEILSNLPESRGCTRQRRRRHFADHHVKVTCNDSKIIEFVFVVVNNHVE
jgi:hypothetical protein